MKQHIKQTIFHFLFWLANIIFLEALLHGVVFGGFTVKFVYAAGFSIAFAGALTLLTTLLPKKIQFPASIVISLLLVLLYGSQMVYNFIFGTLYSVSMMQLGGDALTAFWKETLLDIKDNILVLLMLFLPLIVLIVLRKFRKIQFSSNWPCRSGLVILAILVQVITMQCLTIGGTGFFSDSYFYRSSDTTTNQAAERFGLLTAFRLELTGTEEEDLGYYIEEEDGETEPAEEIPEETVPEETEPAYNVLEIDFDALNELTNNKTIQAINDYCSSLEGTRQNEYTGMLSDYNLIVLCAESFATGAIDPELTPTLYKLANEGIIFNNYYNSFPNTTTDGEYALCMGLNPDGTRDKQHSSFYASRSNYLAFSLGNVFREQKDIQSYGYHNYQGSYYHRNETHPNMGYSMKFARAGMTFTTNWPASDLEMMEQSIDDYIGQDQFHAYYMTFSGHYRYDTSVNFIAKRNFELVEDREDLGYAAKCYLSCNIELDKALEYLMLRLEDAGVADKTAIVLAGDHFPYGLTDKQYSQLVGYELDDFNKYKSTLIFWVGGLEENIVVDEYCCNVDILPTILNLWGFEYDSRMLAGTDVFSDGAHMAVLVDKSFYTDKVWLNTNTGEIRYQVDESEVSDTYIENMIKLIKSRYTMSVNILNTDYYRFAIENGIPTPAPDPVETEPPEEEIPEEAPVVPEPTETPVQPIDEQPLNTPEAEETAAPAEVTDPTEAAEETEAAEAPKATEAPEIPAGTEPVL